MSKEKRTCETCRHAQHTVDGGIILMPLEDGSFTGLLQCMQHSVREKKIVLTKMDETRELYEREE